MTPNLPTQYADDRNLRARQRLWLHQSPPFDLVRWVLDIAELSPGMRVLDAGCGNGAYLRAMRDRHIRAVGCDLSLGMLKAAAIPPLLNADVVALPVASASFDVVLAAHMLYHVPDRASAARELRRALIPGGICIAVTSGSQHLRSLRHLVEQAAGAGTAGWQMRDPSMHVFSLENGAAQLGVAFDSVTCVRPGRAGRVIIRDAAVAADYVASVADHYQDQVARPWQDVVADVRRAVQTAISQKGAFVTAGDTGAFVCQ
jgi:SAM-dependent methyltransferase